MLKKKGFNYKGWFYVLPTSDFSTCDLNKNKLNMSVVGIFTNFLLLTNY